jgi:threonine/homoserine/homoserine lactone efflux protein
MTVTASTFLRLSENHPLIAGILIGLAVAVPVGPVSLMVIRQGIRGGFMKGASVGIGAALSDVGVCLIVLVSVARSIAQRHTTLRILVIAGGLYLVFAGLKGIWDGRKFCPLSSEPGHAFDLRMPSLKEVLRGFIVNALSPATIMLWISLAPNYLRLDQHVIFSLLGIFCAVAGWFAFEAAIAEFAWSRHPRFASIVSQIANAALALLGAGALLRYS